MRILQDLPPKVIVQILMGAVAARLIMDPHTEHAGDRLCGLLPGKVIVQVAMYGFIILQAFQHPFQIMHGVHDEIITRNSNADLHVAGLLQGKVGKKVYEALEHAHLVLPPLMRMSHKRDVLFHDTSLIVWITDLVPAGYIAEGKRKVMPSAQPVMDLPTKHTPQIPVNRTAAQI